MQPMHQEPNIEMKIWEYLDGMGNDDERAQTAALILHDSLWQSKHAEILQLQQSLNSTLELEHTSMRFSKNVMESVAQTSIAPRARKYVNVWVIRVIAAFFILTIGGALISLLSTIEWVSSPESHINLGVDKINLPAFSNMFYAFISLNVIAGLVLLDVLLKRKRTHITP